MRVRTVVLFALMLAAFSYRASGQDPKRLSSERPKRADFNRDIYYRNKLEFSLETGWLPINIPFVFDFLTDSTGGNWGFVVAAGKLHTYNAADAKLATIGPIAGLTWNEILGIAATK